jgi:hypothetical protein
MIGCSGEKLSVLPMVHVVLDTNIFSGNRRRDSGPFHALVRLCHGSKVRLYVPYVVKQEFLSQQTDQARKLFDGILGSANKLRDIAPLAQISKFSNAVEKAADNLKNVVQLVQEEWEEWLKDIGAVEEPIHPSHGQRVIDDYFAGKPPFKTAKSRNDIPDSYVWQAVLNLTQQFQPVHFVTNDKAMASAGAGVQGIKAYEKLAAFIETKECQGALREMAEEVLTKNMRRAGSQLRRVKSELESAIGTEIVNALDGETVTDSSIPDDNNEGMIYMIDEPSKIKFDFDKVEYYGDSEIGVRFEAITECTLNYAIYKGDFDGLDEDKMARISLGERNEHYYDADEEYDIEVTGTLQIKLNAKELHAEKITNVRIRELFEDAEYKVNVDELKVA